MHSNCTTVNLNVSHIDKAVFYLAFYRSVISLEQVQFSEHRLWDHDNICFVTILQELFSDASVSVHKKSSVPSLTVKEGRTDLPEEGGDSGEWFSLK